MYCISNNTLFSLNVILVVPVVRIGPLEWHGCVVHSRTHQNYQDSTGLMTRERECCELVSHKITRGRTVCPDLICLGFIKSTSRFKKSLHVLKRVGMLTLNIFNTFDKLKPDCQEIIHFIHARLPIDHKKSLFIISNSLHFSMLPTGRTRWIIGVGPTKLHALIANALVCNMSWSVRRF